VTQGLATTLRLLKETDNEAAVRVLVPALDSADPRIQEGALVALLNRRNPAAGREILRRMPTMPACWQSIIGQHHGRMTRTLRDALLGTELQMCHNACRAAVWFREYDLLPTLLKVLEDTSQPNADLAAATLLQLTEQLYEELAGQRNPSDRRDPQLIRRYVINALELSVQRFAQHKRREVIEAFLLLVGRDNVTLNQTLQNPHHAALPVMIDVLAKSPRGGIMRLLLGFLDDPHAPSAVLSVIANRTDVKFVQYLLRKIGREPAATVAQTIKRIESVSWLRGEDSFWGQLDDAAQHAAVRLVMTSGIPRLAAFDMIRYLLTRGKPGGRREAAQALAEFHGADANALALRALGDPDPQVQANIILQLRGRGIPGVLPGLVEMVDSPYAAVRRAARESLVEFSFKRYLAAFDMLDEEVRQTSGRLVKKIDPQCVPLLEEELKSAVRTRRLRALAAARAMEAVGALEEKVVDLLADEDHMVRLEAATALAQCASPASRQALERACGDSSEVVRQAARRSLFERTQLHAGARHGGGP
jgi:HEAT repeat protein